MDIYEQQRVRAAVDILGSGGWMMRTPIWWQQTMVEDDNLYAFDILDNGANLGVRVSVNGWAFDYHPTISVERAITRVDYI